MAAVPEREELHRLVDRLTPGQARRLLGLARSDPALTGERGGEETGPRPVGRRLPPMAEPGPDGDAVRRFQSFVGIINSGRGDLSERHEEIIRDGLDSRV